MATAVSPQRRNFSFSNWDWPVVVGIVGMHIAAVVALCTIPQTFSWSGFAIFVVMSWATGGVGITLCYHRLLTHRSFKTPKWFEYFLTVLGALAWQGGPIQWVGVHRLHHAESDLELDPHSPKHGFTWAHMLWCMLKAPVSHREAASACKDLLKDPVTVLIDKYFWAIQFAFGGALYAAGYFIGEAMALGTGHALAVSWLLWGVAVRIVCVYHGTWFVNSASHTWGYRNYETTDHSTNLWWVAIWAFGEGWHNNHHAHQSSARHGLRWWEFDLTWQVIKAMKLVGLARDIRLPTTEQMPKKLKEGPQPVYDRKVKGAVAGSA